MLKKQSPKTREEQPYEQGFYIADHGTEFKKLIRTTLKKGDLDTVYLKHLLKPENLSLYKAAFTHELVNKQENYQYYEMIGDTSMNDCIVWHFKNRFPQLQCAEGVKILSRLKINYSSKGVFADISRKLGFWSFITAENETRKSKEQDLLEDVLEAFIGVTKSILEKEYGIGVGHEQVYKLVSAIFTEMNISLDYEDLYDAKTRLKELFDLHHEKIGRVEWKENMEAKPIECQVYSISNDVGNRRKMIGKGTAETKDQAQQAASKDAIKALSREGIVKHPPKIYAVMAGKTEKQETTREQVLKIIGDESKINDRFPTRGKSRHQIKYMSTVLSNYCRERDKEGIKICLEMGADPNVRDSVGMTATDQLFSGSFEPDILYKICKMLLKACNTFDILSLDIDVQIREHYFSRYLEVEDEKQSKLFRKFEERLE